MDHPAPEAGLRSGVTVAASDTTRMTGTIHTL